MRVRALTRWQKASALVPLAVLVGAWGAALANSDLATASDESAAAAVPEVPGTAFDEPASILPTPLGIDERDGASGTIATLSSSGIPAAAMTAYRRGESLLAEADASCRLPWHLLAAIGRVESDHGRTGGNALDAEGIARPGVYGPVLDGRDGLAEVADTDDGAVDKSSVHDRAVGPLQFLPSTWSLVAVDADDDGAKDPQSISDAATAAGIYLCAGDDDLSTDEGAEEALLRYHRAASYGALVLEVSARYATGEFGQSPAGSPEPSVLASRSQEQTLSPREREQAHDEEEQSEAAPKPDGSRSPRGPARDDAGSKDGTTDGSTGGDAGSGSADGNTGGGGSPSDGANTGGGSTGGGDAPSAGGSDAPSAGPTSGPISNVLTETQARLRCIADGVSVLNLSALTGCIAGLLR